MLPYQTLLQLDRQSSSPIFLQLTNQLVQLIQDGQVPAGAKLPSSRALAKLLQVNRNTISKVYEELEALGWVLIKAKRGAFIVDNFPVLQPTKWISSDLNKPPSKAHFTFYDFPHLQKPQADDALIGFDDGLPDIRLAPINELARNYAKNIRQLAFENRLSYKDGLGNRDLRQLLVKSLNETRGLNITVDNILITRGTIMAIHLAAAATVRAGDKVVVGETNYQTANMVLKHFGADLCTVPVDEKGLVVDAIEQLCIQEKIRAVYVTSHHHHPTTVTLSPERRVQLLQLANAYQFVILEDDYDYDFHFANSPFLPLISGDKSGMVLYFGSFTKLIAPAFRVGYLVGPSRLIQELPKLRRILDRQGDVVLEQTIADLLKDGTIRRHLKKSNRIYKERRDFCCTLLQQELGDFIQFRKPEGGMAIWANLDPTVDMLRFCKKVKQKGIYLSNGRSYHPQGLPWSNIRMGFASMKEAEIERSIGVLKKCR